MSPDITQVKMFGLMIELDELESAVNGWLRRKGGEIDVKETRPIAVVSSDDLPYYGMVITYTTYAQPPQRGPGGMTST